MVEASQAPVQTEPVDLSLGGKKSFMSSGVKARKGKRDHHHYLPPEVAYDPPAYFPLIPPSAAGVVHPGFIPGAPPIFPPAPFFRLKAAAGFPPLHLGLGYHFLTENDVALSNCNSDSPPSSKPSSPSSRRTLRDSSHSPGKNPFVRQTDYAWDRS
ncbi:unnamed protein product [Darwinula stevensoni]|uniref:Uncharacterized protein n=1 Tax=Darwinula stevensoni TaxID=69355 RepID=A0A7R8X1N5_9CRUS|nr:unnamed protein product [Darwinula stevensoni]CAG0882986.1 unnamed protein product [Darwinula stevensoni]